MKQCKLILHDEVNARFIDLDAKTRRACSKSVEFFSKGAQYSWAFKMGHWTGYTSYFEVASGKTYINLLEKIFTVLDECDYEVIVTDLRDPTLYSFIPVTKDILSHITWPKGHFKEEQPIELEDHQTRSINALLKNPHGMLEAATGAGKTIILAILALRVLEYGRVMIIVPNIDLVIQTAEVLIQMGVDAGEFYGGKKELTKPVLICTWQSVSAFFKKPRGMEQLTTKEVETALTDLTAVIADECHGMKAKAIRDLFCNQFKNIPLRWGMTGTIPKDPAEKIILELNLGKVVLEVHTKELQDLGFLAESEIDIYQIVEKTKYVDHLAELEALVYDPEKISYFATLIEHISQTGNTLVLFNRIKTGDMLLAELQERGIEVDYVNGGVAAKNRKERYNLVQKGDNMTTLATSGVAAIGIDIPRLHNVVLIEIGKSFIRCMQSLGRGLRRGQGKDKIYIHDIAATTKYSSRHLRERVKYYKEKEQEHTIHKITDWRSYS